MPFHEYSSCASPFLEVAHALNLFFLLWIPCLHKTRLGSWKAYHATLFAHPPTKGLARCHLPIVLWRARHSRRPYSPTSQLTNFSMIARNPFGSLNSTAVRRHLDAYNRLKTPLSFTTWDKITRRLDSWKRLKVGGILHAIGNLRFTVDRQWSPIPSKQFDHTRLLRCRKVLHDVMKHLASD